jgi:hypothetical protein
MAGKISFSETEGPRSLLEELFGGEGRDDLNEHLVNPPVQRELGMEGGGHDGSLAHQAWESLPMGQSFDAGADLDDAWGADEDHLQRTAGEGGFGDLNAGVDLAAVGITLDDGVQQPQGALRRIDHFAGKQDGASAGAEDGLFAAKLLQRFKEVALFEELEHGGGFPAWKDEAVEFCKLLGLADFRGLGAGLGEGLGVGGVIALDSEDANFGFYCHAHHHSPHQIIELEISEPAR